MTKTIIATHDAKEKNLLPVSPGICLFCDKAVFWSGISTYNRKFNKKDTFKYIAKECAMLFLNAWAKELDLTMTYHKK